jgi:hypothetical protein
MRKLSQSLKIGIVASVVMAIGGIGLILFPKNPADSDNTPITMALKQSQMLRDMASRTTALGIQRQNLSWDGQNAASLSQIYQDFWPITPPAFPDTPPLVWQMGWAGDHLVFFLEGLSPSTCQALNAALNIKDPLPESPWSKQDLLRRKASFPPTADPRLQKRGCVKTIFATHLYYDVL